MFVDYFIRRPVFATVGALLIVLAGAVAIPTLQVAQYPQLAPPQVTVTAAYTGAAAQTVESAVTTPLEQALNGVEGMKNIQSTSGSDGSSNVTVTFDVQRDIDLAAVDVQNRVTQALGRLPSEVKATGVAVTKSSSSMVFGAAFWCDHGEYSNQFISNYVDVFVRDALKRVKGVASVDIWGERRYAMRLWIDPMRLAARKLTASDVVRALREQNVQVAAGQLGQEPARPTQPYQIGVRVAGRLARAEEFGRIVVASGAHGALVTVADVGRVELGSEDYSTLLRFDGREALGIGVMLLPNANAIEVDREAQKVLAELAHQFPPGLRHAIAFDPTTAVHESIAELLWTIAVAIVLVIAVIFVFLQSWRSTLIPAVTIPVSLVGTLIFVKAFGFSINTLTLFGLTLATGLVVDDAIVVIENIERHRAHGRVAEAAASTATAEVAGAIVATSLVLVAVFVPVALFPGTLGRLYEQFCLTIAFSVALSAFNALTLTPALSALWLRRRRGAPGRFFGGVNRAIERATLRYDRSLRWVTRHTRAAAVVFVAVTALVPWLQARVPGGFVPDEDQGYLMVMMQAPPGGSLHDTARVAAAVDEIVRAQPEVADTLGLVGWSFAGTGGNKAILFVNLRPSAERRGAAHSVDAVLERLRPKLDAVTGAVVLPFGPPALQGVGNFGGFALELQDRGGNSIETVADATQETIAEAGRRPELTGLFTGFTADDPQLLVGIDRARVERLRIGFGQVADALQIYMGSLYVNDFELDHRGYRVYVQADREFRSQPRDLARLYLRSTRGRMVPLDTVAKLELTKGPSTITHYNLFRAVEIDGAAAPGFSTGQALAAMEAAARKALPQGMSFEWTGLALEQRGSGAQTFYIFALGLLFVYLVLAAQYESFVLPVVILFAVPMAILGALAAQWLRGLTNDVFFQIGLLMLVGLAAKNSILIVEFAEKLRQSGLGAADAVVEAARIRLRPIVMTSLALMLGVMPLAAASGVGANSRRSLGTAVLGGMLVSTLLNLYLIPVVYVLVVRFRERRRERACRHA